MKSPIVSWSSIGQLEIVRNGLVTESANLRAMADSLSRKADKIAIELNEFRAMNNAPRKKRKR
jgi:hypothetical protein